MVPIGWNYALMIWGYALAWFVVNDEVKMATLRFLLQHNGGGWPLNGPSDSGHAVVFSVCPGRSGD